MSDQDKDFLVRSLTTRGRELVTLVCGAPGCGRWVGRIYETEGAPLLLVRIFGDKPSEAGSVGYPLGGWAGRSTFRFACRDHGALGLGVDNDEPVLLEFARRAAATDPKRPQRHAVAPLPK